MEDYKYWARENIGYYIGTVIGTMFVTAILTGIGLS